MTNENLGSKPIKCVHKWSKIHGSEQEDGTFTSVCDHCHESIQVRPPKTETAQPKKPPLLTE